MRGALWGLHQQKSLNRNGLFKQTATKKEIAEAISKDVELPGLDRQSRSEDTIWRSAASNKHRYPRNPPPREQCRQRGIFVADA